jgi:hypothetical protein
MTSSTQEYLVRRKAFAEEFEKLGGVPAGLIGKLLAKIMSKSTVAKDMVGRVSSFASKHSTQMTNPAAAYSKSGKVYEQGMEALKTTTGKSTVKPWLGKSRQPLGIRESKKIDLFKDPLRSVGQTVMTGAANLAMTGKTIAKKGLGKYLKEDFARTQYFSKQIAGKGGKKYDVLAKRSLAGKITSPVFDTGVGFGGLALATNKYDDQGQKRGIASRIGSAAKESVLWGPLRPLAMAHLTTVELPKMTKDIIKGF